MEFQLTTNSRPVLGARMGSPRLNRTSRTVFALAALSLMLSGCTDGKEGPFLTAQLCVQDKAGIVQLIDELKAVAISRGMRFVDNSADTERDLGTVGYAGRERADGSPTINVAVERGDGMGVGAVNVGLPGYQVALGFTEGSDGLETQRFADEVIAKLEKQWQLERLPTGSAALPKPGCR